MCPGPSIITCTSYSQAFFVSSPSVFSSANCAASLASAMHPGRSPSPSEKLTSCFWKILQISSKCSYSRFCRWFFTIHSARIAPPRLTIPVMRFGGQRNVLHQHAGVDGHVIDALLGLLLDHFEHHVDVQVFHPPHARQRFINRHRADRHRRFVDDGFADARDVAAGRKIHHACRRRTSPRSAASPALRRCSKWSPNCRCWR